jgi:hypothetical protein
MLGLQIKSHQIHSNTNIKIKLPERIECGAKTRSQVLPPAAMDSACTRTGSNIPASGGMPQ